jgi:hypothetical protein
MTRRALVEVVGGLDLSRIGTITFFDTTIPFSMLISAPQIPHLQEQMRDREHP